MNAVPYAVNSLQYWEQRFSENWGDAGGPAQTRFFGAIALSLLPSRIREDIDRHCKTLVDIGCAEGEAAAMLKAAFPSLQVSGFDFSEQAIETARSRHPEVEFHALPLDDITERYDVVMCSNVLEHFTEPRVMLERLARIAKRHLLILVPGWETERHPEHEVTFRLRDFPRVVEGLHLAHVAAVNCNRIDPEQWPGYQLLLLYCDAKVIEALGTTAGDLMSMAHLADLSVQDLADLEGKDADLQRLCELSARQHTVGSRLKIILKRLEAIGERQEAIGYNSRHELLGAFSALQGEIVQRFEGIPQAHPEPSLDELTFLRREYALSLERAVNATRERDAAVSEAASARLTLSDMEAQLKQKGEELEHLRAAGEQREQEISELKRVTMENKLQQRLLEQGIEERERAMVQIATEQEYKDARINGLEAGLAQLQTQLSLLNRALQQTIEKSAWREIHDTAMLDAWRKYAAALDEDRGRLANQALAMQQQVRDLRASTSWKLGAPLRWVSHKLMGRAPAPSLTALEGPRSVALSCPPLPSASDWPSKPELIRSSPVANESEPRDLLWSEFEQQVLAKRELYRGIFVQEVVIDWNVPLYQRPQHIAAAMGRIGYLVIYRTVNWTNDNVQGCREVAPNVWLTNCVEVDNLTKAARSLYSTAYADDPVNLQRRPADNLLTYEYIDHIDPQISGDTENIARLLRLKDWAFQGGAHLIIASARVLEAEAIAAAGPDRVVLVPNGVDTRHYRDPTHSRTPLPETLLEFRKRYSSIVGYFGAIAPWLWYDAIAELVASRPDIGFVFIGPDYYGGTERLPRGDNVLYLGTVDYRVLPAYARLFDVCFIPFEPGEIARTTSPLKLFEYFALEKPVVVTADMVECVAHSEVFCGGSVAELASAIDAALAVKDCAQHRARLRQLADENDWDRRAETLAHAIERLNGGRSGASIWTDA